MAALGQAFNASTVEPATAIELLPPGEYIAQIVRSEMKPTKNGNGQYLELEMSILEGQYTNRRLFDRLNLVNPNQTAQEIAHRTLSAICHAVNMLQDVNDSEVLHFKPLRAVVKVAPGKGEYGPRNEISGYKSAGGTSAPRAAAAPAAQKPAGTPPPWRR